MPTSPPFDRVVLDCDSTLSTIEGIDELAEAGDVALRRKVAALTDGAMAGELSFAQVYERRLDALRPTQMQVRELAALYVKHALPYGRELVSALHTLGKDVHVVSGGLRLAVQPFAAWLGVQDERKVHAVQLRFDRHGHYSDYDRSSPLARQGGKPEVLAALPPARTVVVGDGMTDAEAGAAVDGFVCFAGVVHREAVAARADATVTSDHLAGLLPHLCTPAELEHLAAHPRHASTVRWARNA